MLIMIIVVVVVALDVADATVGMVRLNPRLALKIRRQEVVKPNPFNSPYSTQVKDTILSPVRPPSPHGGPEIETV